MRAVKFYCDFHKTNIALFLSLSNFYTSILFITPPNNDKFMEKVCGLDVHKDSVFACILDEMGKKLFEKRYGTLTPNLTELRERLIEKDCSRVAHARYEQYKSGGL